MARPLPDCRAASSVCIFCSSPTDVPDPKIEEPTDVIIRIGGAGVCRTDLHVIEGIWQEKIGIELPYIMGHENAGWVEEVGSGVSSLRKGDPVICHPVVTKGTCLACRRGDDMHALESEFPGMTRDGGYAEYLRTGERALIKLPTTLAPKDVAPYTDAGLTAYHVAKKAARQLHPEQKAVMIGVGGLGHIGVQCLRALSPVDIIAVDRSDMALDLARQCGARHLVKADGNEVEAVMQLNAELIELMDLADRGHVELSMSEYPLADANRALHDLHHGRVRGRAVLVP